MEVFFKLTMGQNTPPPPHSEVKIKILKKDSQSLVFYKGFLILMFWGIFSLRHIYILEIGIKFRLLVPNKTFSPPRSSNFKKFLYIKLDFYKKHTT
jgi:hypothetical protein